MIRYGWRQTHTLGRIVLRDWTPVLSAICALIFAINSAKLCLVLEEATLLLWILGHSKRGWDIRFVSVFIGRKFLFLSVIIDTALNEGANRRRFPLTSFFRWL